MVQKNESRDVEVQVKTEPVSNRDVEVQVETGPVSNSDATVHMDGDTEIEDLRRKNENMAKELANKQAVIEAHENQLADYYQSILEMKAELKMAQEKNDVQNQMESALEAVFTITKKNKGPREQLENKVKREKNLNDKIVRMTNIGDQMKKELSATKDVICSLKKELQKRDLEKVIKEKGMGDVERCETAAEDDNKGIVVKEEKQEGEDGPTRKLLIRKPKKKKPKEDKDDTSK
ncbi:uncharacterized protein [Palaemon carinicauda]|uniref:uncharacterized protein n=1 Tax=Palaemon carinicauda TaxID=392227 RepID=UPI0035B57874